ncbi:MAG: phosphotransacetylase family protein [Archaeoglobus sp.]|nr:phosphotransacetylase family protein [Archaeoglobus sp.]
MTKGLLVSSVEGKSGKSAMIIAMASILKEKGYEVGFFKPFGTSPEYQGEEIVDGDALNTAKLIGSEDDPRDICPVVLEVPYAEFVNVANPKDLRDLIKKSYERVSEGKDVMLVEGSVDYKIGSSVGLGDVAISNLLNLKDLLVVKYSDDFVLDKILAAKELFGERLEKVIFNKLSGYKRSYIDGIAGTLLKKRGMEILGIIPRDAIIGGVFIDEISDFLHGEYLVKPKESMIIENIIVGAMSPNSAIEYFRKTKNAALVTGGDRSDLQIVALEIPNIKLMVLTGNLRPSKFVMERAENRNVPILVVSEDTLTTTERLYEMFDQAKIRSGIKQKRVVELFESFVNVKSFLSYLES